MNIHYIPFERMWGLSEEDRLNALRFNILYMITQAGAGHLGSALSSLEIIYHILVKEVGPNDIFFSSKGHDCAAIYAVLMLLGKLPEDYLHNFRRLGGLPGHPENWISGVITGSGSLGMGLSKAQGIALAGHEGRIFVLSGDGELQEGQVDEAIRNISNKCLKNIYLLVDYNKWQCDYRTNRITQFPLGWTPYICFDGNDLENIRVVFDSARHSEAPCYMLFDTVKSYGMPWSGSNTYHGGFITDDDYLKALNYMPYGSLLPISISVPRKPRNSVRNTNSLNKDYGEVLFNLMCENTDIVVCSADLVKDCSLETVQVNPRVNERFHEFGISEQDMVSAAGGMAIKGKIPIVHSFSSFLCRRANEQIYNNCCDGHHIIYVGFLSGVLPYGPGPSHTCLADAELMSTMPDMIVLEPRTREDLEDCLTWAVYHYDRSVYIKIPCLPVVEGVRR